MSFYFFGNSSNRRAIGTVFSVSRTSVDDNSCGPSKLCKLWATKSLSSLLFYFNLEFSLYFNSHYIMLFFFHVKIKKYCLFIFLEILPTVIQLERSSRSVELVLTTSLADRPNYANRELQNQSLLFSIILNYIFLFILIVII